MLLADTTFMCLCVWSGLVCAEKRALYEFIVRHFLASCSKDAVGQETNVTIDIGGEAFRTTGKHAGLVVSWTTHRLGTILHQHHVYVRKEEAAKRPCTV